ncbi:respiratory nitrate reductase subunit gamma [Balneatrix alpica]|uniref:Respiratory nitrate reductase subunit gamma n=1 Tax=Balneatrix alpica TaxID=75684 RepID=A0ABV5ZB64_9GAMM|nr:respiratory nitrate reductase subunit gamma [Balneatrix alpica]
MSYLNELLFGLYPYVAGAVFLIGSWVRYDREQFTWRAGSSQMLRSAGMRRASNLFHVGILMIFFGHLVGLLTPHAVYEVFLTSAAKQKLAITFGGIAGVMCWIGAFSLFKRRLTDPRVRNTGSRNDLLVIALLLAQVTLGLLTILPSLGHMDGSVMLQLAAWAQAIVTFQGGAAAHIADVNVLYKIHILLGLTLFLIFPFTRLVHVWSVPVKYLARSYQIVRARG